MWERKERYQTKGAGGNKAGGEKRINVTHSISLHSERPLVNYSRANDSAEETTRTLLLLLQTH